jgi:hypothetical protein
MYSPPRFGHPPNPALPHGAFQIRVGVASVSEGVMGTALDHRRCAEECVAMARLAEDDHDKALWLSLAQSWLRLADHVMRAQMQPACVPDDNAAA